MNLQGPFASMLDGARVALWFVAASLVMPRPQAPAPVRSVPSLDLARYAGKWFEIARYPNRFQNKCASDVTAEYEQLPDGRIRVVNACRQSDSSMTRAEGIARLADREGPPSQLKVRFAPRFLSSLSAVWGDYWIIGLAPDYSYAVVGDPSRSYLWILSRTRTLDAEPYQRALDAATSNGFDVSRLVRTIQSP